MQIMSMLGASIISGTCLVDTLKVAYRERGLPRGHRLFGLRHARPEAPLKRQTSRVALRWGQQEAPHDPTQSLQYAPEFLIFIIHHKQHKTQIYISTRGEFSADFLQSPKSRGIYCRFLAGTVATVMLHSWLECFFVVTPRMADEERPAAKGDAFLKQGSYTLGDSLDGLKSTKTFGASLSGPPPALKAADDLVLTGLRLTLSDLPPTDEEGNVLALEIAITPSSNERFCKTPLTTTEEDPLHFQAHKLQAQNGDELRISVSVSGCATPLFEAPLEELGIGGSQAGRISEAVIPQFTGELAEGAVTPAGSASIACAWRTQRSLPPPRTGLDRCRSLCMRYASPIHRDEFTRRLELWRTEMSDVTKEPNYLPHGFPVGHPHGPSTWAQPWLPPYIPHHMKGGPLTQEVRNAYLQGGEDMKALLRAQAVRVQLTALMDVLPTCQTAEQAVRALEEVHTFLESSKEEVATTHQVSPNGVRYSETFPVTHHTLPQIDAAATLRLVRRLNLPFERLVRNVWMEGPEVQYDRSKAALEGLLAAEVARRKTAEASPPPAERPADLASKFGVVFATTRIHEGKNAPRRGLLNFPGKPKEVKRAPKPFGE